MDDKLLHAVLVFAGAIVMSAVHQAIDWLGLDLFKHVRKVFGFKRRKHHRKHCEDKRPD